MDFDSLMGALMIILVPGIFVFVGVTLIWKSGKEVYKWSFRYKKVTANCVEIQQIKEDQTTLYRPIFEYEENGHIIRACTLDYLYRNEICVGNMVPITVEVKHPDVVVEIGGKYNLVQQYVNLALGVFLIIVSFPTMLSVIFTYIVNAF